MIDQVKWDRRWLLKAKEFSSFSKDPSTRVGAVIVDGLGRIVSEGWNGFPRGVSDDPERYLDRELKYKLICHAEQNAIWAAGDRARGSTIYVWPSFAIPNICHECAKAAIQSGIIRVVGGTPSPEDKELGKRWAESIGIAEMMLREAGVRVTEVPW